MKRILPVSIVLSSLFGLRAAQAQTPPPDAGSLRQQIEKGLPQLAPRPKELEPVLPPARPGQQGATLSVRRFRFVGNSLIDSTQLALVLDSYLNRPIDFHELQQATQAVAKAYHDAGWIIEAYLPQQDATDGTVTIQIVEAVFGGVSFEGEPPTRVPLSQLLALIEERQKKGEPLRAGAIDRGLLLADDLPGVSVRGSLRPGDNNAETQLVVKAVDEPPITGFVGIDNSGSESTGAKRSYVTGYLNSPDGRGDLATGHLLHTDGWNYLRLGWSVPVEHDGWRVGANTSLLNYKLINSGYSGLNGEGASSSLGAEASYPLIRSAQSNLNLQFASDLKWFDNQLNGLTTSNYASWAHSATLSNNFTDTLHGGGSNTLSVGLVYGKLNLNGSPNQVADAATTRAAESYSKLRYSASREQYLQTDLSLLVGFSGQFARKNLDSSEKFYLGGADGVRAYALSDGNNGRNYSVTLVSAPGKIVDFRLASQLPNVEPLDKAVQTQPIATVESKRLADASTVAVNRRDTVAIDNSSHVLNVTLARLPSSQDTGLITVHVPQENVRSGFSFMLPAQLLDRATPATPISATLSNGEQLPAWLQLAENRRSFIAHPPSVNDLPVEVRVQINGMRSNVLITKQISRDTGF